MLARECGWSIKYIEENLTYAQVKKYCEIITKQKKQDLLLETISRFRATAYAFGGIKKEDFDKFIKMLDGSAERPTKLGDLKKISSILIEEK